jgi:hypothetical protein
MTRKEKRKHKPVDFLQQKEIDKIDINEANDVVQPATDSSYLPFHTTSLKIISIWINIYKQKGGGGGENKKGKEKILTFG